MFDCNVRDLLQHYLYMYIYLMGYEEREKPVCHNPATPAGQPGPGEMCVARDISEYFLLLAFTLSLPQALNKYLTGKIKIMFFIN